MTYDELPLPFNNKELYNYFVKMNNGDKTARKEIIEHNMRLVVGQVKGKFSNSFFDEEELISVGMVGLINSVDTFDINKKIRFSTYAIRCINNEILMFLRYGKKIARDCSLETPIGSDKTGNELRVIDTLFDEKSDFVSDYENQENYKIVRQIVSELSVRDERIIKMYFGFLGNEPMTQQEIADEEGISQQNVSAIIKKQLIQIERLLQERGFDNFTRIRKVSDK